MYTMKMYAIRADKNVGVENIEWLVFLNQSKRAAIAKIDELREFDGYRTDSGVFYCILEYTLDDSGTITYTRCI